MDYRTLYYAIRHAAAKLEHGEKDRQDHESASASYLREAFEGGEAPQSQRRLAPEGGWRCPCHHLYVDKGHRMDDGSCWCGCPPIPATARAEAQADGAGPVGEVLTASSAEAGWMEQAQRARRAEKERDRALADLAEARKGTERWRGRHGQANAMKLEAMAKLEAEKFKVSEARRESLGVIEGLQNELAAEKKRADAIERAFDAFYESARKEVGAQTSEVFSVAARRVVKERDEARQAEVLKATCPHCRQPVLLLAAPEEVK